MPTPINSYSDFVTRIKAAKSWEENPIILDANPEFLWEAIRSNDLAISVRIRIIQFVLDRIRNDSTVSSENDPFALYDSLVILDCDEDWDIRRWALTLRKLLPGSPGYTESIPQFCKDTNWAVRVLVYRFIEIDKSWKSSLVIDVLRANLLSAEKQLQEVYPDESIESVSDEWENILSGHAKSFHLPIDQWITTHKKVHRLKLEICALSKIIATHSM